MIPENEIAVEGINRTAGVCGGRACIRNTRIAVWTLVELKMQGLTEPALIDAYPGLTISEMDAGWKYFRHHRSEIMADIDEQREDDEN